MSDVIGALVIFALLFAVVAFGLLRSERAVRNSASHTRNRDENRTEVRAADTTDPVR